MASQNEVLFAKDSVYIHINVQDTKDKDAHIAGRVYLMKKPEGNFIEWKAEECLSHDIQNDEWDVIGSVGFRNDRDSECVSMNAKMDARRKYNISFDVLDLKSFKRNAPNHSWAYIIFILKDGTTFPALHFHNGGSKALLKELETFIHIRRSPNDQRLFIVHDHDPEMLSKSFNELSIFSDSSSAYVQKFVSEPHKGFPKKFMKDPYTATMGGFSKVTNFLRDNFMAPENLTRPQSEMAEFLHEDIPGMEISNLDEPGFEMVTKTKLPPRPVVKRSEHLELAKWNSFFDSDGTISQVEEVKEIIFRGGVDPAIRSEVWKFLLGFYDWDSTTKKRQEQRKRKVDDYFRMKLQWKTISSEQERRFTLLKERRGLIDKDVMRTDRTHKFFSGDKNPNLQVLYDILMTYCMYNFDLGYVQGMSDILAPILVVMENEVDAFWCFAGAMERVCHNFEMDQNGMKVQLSQIHKLMQVYDPELCAYLESHDSGNFYFCFRWILIMFKREFHFHEIQRLWEVIWTDLPCQNFHLIISLAILDSEKSTLMENKFGFTEILKHINDISLSIPLDDTLCKAEGIFLQLKEFKKLPKAVKEVLGLLPVPVSQSMENSVFIGSASNTDVKSQDSASRVDTPQLMGGISSSSSISVNGSRSSHSLGGKQNSIIDEGSKILT
ncbi:TBC1 domain family member 15-like isoform X1 [Biomphalaria glabrata]|uniref:TBC1 domain family member 15 n=1 Tax=Biomphalaria glabrata TaxID=6526 RepID=A0A2C9LSD6_BIOGL|nr:TBC1 domain family member 15-like isoform X1 [Biomphalaria glabrata]